MIQTLQHRSPPRRLAWALALSLAAPVTLGVAGCGNNGGGSGGSGGGGSTASAPATAPMASPAADPNAGAGQAAPTGAGAAPAGTAPAKPGISNGEKAVIVLAGAALLYYLYKKHQAAQQAQGGAAGGAAGQQLYRSANGGVYYRNAQHQAVWLTVPGQPQQVPASEVQQYAPDYQQYQGQPAPAPPAGATTAPFSSLLRGL